MSTKALEQHPTLDVACLKATAGQGSLRRWQVAGLLGCRCSIKVLACGCLPKDGD